MKNFKRILCATFTIVIFASTFSGVAAKADNIAGKNEQETSQEIHKIYQDGKNKGILNDSNMPYDSFAKNLNESVIPNINKNNNNQSLEQFVSNNNYLVPYSKPSDTPTTVTDGTNNNQYNIQDYTNAKNGYNMKSGDILVVHGNGIPGSPVYDVGAESWFVGHAAIATSSNYVLHMPGQDQKAEHWSKKAFFKKYSNDSSHVWVYRMKNHPHYADNASTYAWNNMYKKNNPSYSIYKTGLYENDPSYCSKYVYLAYWRSGCSNHMLDWIGGLHVVTPFGLPGNFKDDFYPTLIHKIVSYQ